MNTCVTYYIQKLSWTQSPYSDDNSSCQKTTIFYFMPHKNEKMNGCLYSSNLTEDCLSCGRLVP